MNKDPLYARILTRLDAVTDGNLFEACACDLLRPEWPNLVPVPGGTDDGMDGAWTDGDGLGILIATTNKSVISNVTKNLKQHIAKGRKGRQVLVATTRKLSPTQAKTIESRIRELGFSVAHQPYERQALADRLYHNSRWLKELLGLSGLATALSRIPKGLRPLRDISSVGRDSDLEWLKRTRGDRLLVGQSGSGKTFLCKELAGSGKALFVTDRHLDRLADAIRDQEPTAIIVEDSHLNLELLAELKHFREESGAEFEIIAECWPAAAFQVQAELQVPNTKVRVLSPLSAKKIVELTKAAGISGPNWLLRLVVRQSLGYPGRAALLIHLCLTDSDLDDVFSGKALARWVHATFSRLVGDRVKSLLAGFAIGGEHGLPINKVSHVLGYAPGDIYEAMSKLVHGGIVYQYEDGRLCVMPEPLRSALIADCFFDGPVTIPLGPFLDAAINLESICNALIAAQARGASISSKAILEVLVAIPNTNAWEQFVWTSEENADLAFQQRAELVLQYPNAFLHMAPELVLPTLLQAAVGDDRELHSHPNHPLRLIKDWVDAAEPGTGEAIKRRRALWEATKRWQADGGDLPTCLRAISSVVSPRYESHESDPGDRNTVQYRRGSVAITDLQQITELWPEIVSWLSPRRVVDWVAITDAIEDWVHPARFGNHLTDAHYRLFETTSVDVIRSVSLLAKGRFGVLAKLRELAAFLDATLEVEIDPDFEVLYPTDPYDAESVKPGWEAEQADAVRSLARKWLSELPRTVVSKLMSCIREASAQRRTWLAHSQWICSLLAAEVEDARPWIDAMIAEDANGDYILPFLRVAAVRNADVWLEIVDSCLDSPTRSGAAAVALLNSPEQAVALENKLLHTLRVLPRLITHNEIRGQISIGRLKRMLSDDNIHLRSTVVDELWRRKNEFPIPECLLETWHDAIIRGGIKSYHLSEMFKSDSTLAFNWLANRATTQSDHHYDDKKAIEIATSVLPPEQKKAILEQASDEIYLSERIIKSVIGNDLQLYRWFLTVPNHKRLFLAPFHASPDDAWVQLAILALDSGKSAEDMVRESFRSVMLKMGSVPSKYEAGATQWGVFLTHVDPRVREMAALGKRLHDEQARYYQKREETEGFEENYLK